MRPAVALLLASLCLASRAEEAAPAWAVIKIVRGEDVTFQALPEKDLAPERARITQEATEEIRIWEVRKDAFLKDKANRRKTFLEPKPESATASLAKAPFPTEAEARQYAEEQQKKAEGKHAVIRITGTDGQDTLEVIRQNKIKAKEAELRLDYQKQLSDWNDKKDAFYKAIKGGQPDAAGESTAFEVPAPKEPKLTRIKEGIADPDEAKRILARMEKPEKAKR